MPLRDLDGKKSGPTENRGPLSVKVKNLQRGTAETTELGGKPSCCINRGCYARFLTKWKTFFVQGSYANAVIRLNRVALKAWAFVNCAGLGHVCKPV